MSEFGRIDKSFWDHPKVKQAGNAAIGLWAKANAWTRDKRSGGFIPRETALELGTFEEVGALINAGLWLKVFDEQGVIGFKFKDYDHWNDDVEPDTQAGNLVRRVIPKAQPVAIRQQLVRRSAELLKEGIDPEIVERALNIWLTKGLGPSLLPNLVSEAMSEARRAATLRNTVTECIKTGQVSPLKQFGFIFTPPDAPEGLDVNQRRAFMARAKQQWLNQVRERAA